MYGSQLGEVDFWASGVPGRRGVEISIRGKILKERALQGRFEHASLASEAEGFEGHEDGSVRNSVEAWFEKRTPWCDWWIRMGRRGRRG